MIIIRMYPEFEGGVKPPELTPTSNLSEGGQYSGMGGSDQSEYPLTCPGIG